MKKLLTSLLMVAMVVTGSNSLFAEQSNGVGTSESFRGPVGVCMYSLRDICQKESVDAAMKFAEDHGFTIAEASGFFGLTATEYKALLDKHGLYVPSLPVGYGQLTKKESLDKIIADAKALNVKYVRVASIPHSKENPFDLEAAREAVRVFNEAGKYLAEAGLSYMYHNHGFEFVKYEGCPEDECLFDLMVRECDPRYVCFQMDIVWVANPGYDPVTYLKRYPNRFKTMHVKDFSSKNGMLFSEGKLDLPAILKTAQETGVEYYFLEHDDTRNMSDVMPKNIEYLEAIKF